MKEENEINEEVQQLLDSLEQHGQNVRRQKELGDLIDSLAAGTSLRGASATKQSIVDNGGLPRRSASSAPHNDAKHGLHSSNDAKRRKLYPIWWIVGAAAACLLLWLLARPARKETPNMNEEIFVEETGTKDTTATQEEHDTIEESVILEEPVLQKLLAEETPTKKTKPQTKTNKPTQKAVEEISEELVLAENTAIESTKTEPIDTSNIGSNSIPYVKEEELSTVNYQLSTQSSPQRRVVRSLNLVCYECQKELDYTPHSSLLTPHSEKTLFGQPQDPNMKNGSLAFELKLH